MPTLVRPGKYADGPSDGHHPTTFNHDSTVAERGPLRIEQSVCPVSSRPVTRSRFLPAVGAGMPKYKPEQWPLPIQTHSLVSYDRLGVRADAGTALDPPEKFRPVVPIGGNGRYAMGRGLVKLLPRLIAQPLPEPWPNPGWFAGTRWLIGRCLSGDFGGVGSLDPKSKTLSASELLLASSGLEGQHAANVAALQVCEGLVLATYSITLGPTDSRRDEPVSVAVWFGRENEGWPSATSCAVWIGLTGEFSESR